MSTRAVAADRGAVVVCLTSQGGHVEHAYNVAHALARETGSTSTLISRTGATDYLPELPEVSLVEIGHFVEEQGIVGKVRRAVRETVAVRRALRARTGRLPVVLEEPVMALAVPLRMHSDLIAVVHNVREHDDEQADLATMLRCLLKWVALVRADRVLVHGRQQARAVMPAFRAKVRVVELPGVGPFENASGGRHDSDGPDFPADSLVCLGEIRPNKNYEEAIRAAAVAGVPLVVAGLLVKPGYLDVLREVATSAQAEVIFAPGFLDPPTFATILATCRALVLPYRFFAAQSGILERGLAAGSPAIVSDLPALVEQTADRVGVSVYPAGDIGALADLMRQAISRGAAAGCPTEQIDERWSTVARQILG